MDDLSPPQRGDIYRVSLRGEGQELRGPHYVVVVSDDPFNYLSTVVVVPFSSQAQPSFLHPEAVVRGTRTRALVEQVRVLSRQRLREHVGSLAGTTAMDEIDEQLRQLLALGSD